MNGAGLLLWPVVAVGGLVVVLALSWLVVACAGAGFFATVRRVLRLRRGIRPA